MMAVTIPVYHLGYNFSYRSTAAGGRVTIRPTTFKVTASQTTTIYRPKDAEQWLIDHEMGHYKLDDYAYRRLAKAANLFAIRALAKSFEGAAEDEAKSLLNQDFGQNLRLPYLEPLGELTKRYEEFTHHGMVKEITADEAVRQIIQERAVAPSTRPSSKRPATRPPPRDRR